MKKFLIVANWKMNPKTVAEAVREADKIEKSARKLKRVKTVIAPPLPFLGFLLGKKGIEVGAQDISPDRGIGAATGEVSGAILKRFGVRYVIVGHSERRARGEDNETVSEKTATALKEGVTPIVCVGEQKRDEEGKYLRELRDEIRKSLARVPKTRAKNIVIAYEPIWAVGAEAKAADNPEETLETVLFIKKCLSEVFDRTKADSIPILYGGSVTPKNAATFLERGGVKGLLVGRASLTPQTFIKILHHAENAGKK